MDEPSFSVGKLQLEDVSEFIALQDLFAEEHLAFTRPLYALVTLLDWQRSLLWSGPALDEPRGRERHVEKLVRREEAPFRKLVILKATANSAAAGYIMYQPIDAARPRRRAQGQCHAQGYGRGPWTQLKQIFVRREWRRRGCGKLLLNSMIQALDGECCNNVRLSVLELNHVALRWYRSVGFAVFRLYTEFIGEREQANAILYLEMQRGEGNVGVPALFKGEVVNEVITIDYPDKSGAYEVRIVGYDGHRKWHYVDSCGLSLWDGETFTDTINLNQFFRDGHISFSRPLSLVHRDVELSKREARRAKADLKRQRISA